MTIKLEKLTIRWTGDMQRLEIKPGDKFVLTLTGMVSDDAHKRIQSIWKEFAGEGVPLLVLDPGEKLGVVGTGK